jgi:hypothetical protein
MRKLVPVILICISLGFSFTKYPGFHSRGSDSALYRDVSAENIPVLSGPGMDVETADIDADGDKDIFIASEYQPNILLINNGNGFFADSSIRRLPRKFLDDEDIALADFDMDGDIDVVFAVEDHRTHQYYLNDGNGNFMNDVSARLPNSTGNSVLAEDINNDSVPDLVFGNSGPGHTEGQNTILINNGSGMFTDETSSRMPAVLDVTQDIKMGDLDGDGDKDMVVGNELGNKIHINNGSGFFTEETIARLPLPGNEETRKVTLGDVDNDNDLDIFFSNVRYRAGMNAQDRLLINNGSGVFTDETSTRLPAENDFTLDGIFVDVDFDSDLDLVTVHKFYNMPVRILQNNGSGVYTDISKWAMPPGIAGEWIGIKADYLNADNLQDLFLLNKGFPSKMLFRNDTAVVGINLTSTVLPEGIELSQNYPNPFNPSTVIRFTLKEAGRVKLSVHDVTGRLIKLLVQGQVPAGESEVTFDASGLAGGIYYYTLKASTGAGEVSVSRKMMLIK